MKPSLLLSIIFFFFLTSVQAQVTMSPVEKELTGKLCDCFSKLDFTKITDKPGADKAFMNCFSVQAGLVLQLAQERKIEMSDRVGMRGLGEELGKKLVGQNCQSFLQLSMLMAKESDPDAALTGTTEGRLKRMDTKDFNYLVVTDTENKEKSFIWLRQFNGSENFTGNVSKLVGQKLKISWQEMEVFIPSAKNYYKIKEVTGVEVMP
jgi:hypothetical protein